MDRSHRRFCALQLSPEADQSYTREYVGMRFITRLDNKLLALWEVINLSKVESAGSTLVLSGTFFVEQLARAMNTPLCFWRSIDWECTSCET